MAEQFMVTLQDGTILKGWHWEKENATHNFTLITGMDEYAFRYDRLARFLNDNGINVYVLDALGQGLNAESVEKQELWPEDGFAKNVEAIHLMIELAKTNGLPTTHMGHSMGSFLTQSLMQKYPKDADKIILCGSNGGQGFLMKAGYLMAKMKVNKKNWDKECPMLQNLGLGGYTKAIKDRKTDLDWLSYNEENVKTYIEDPYCGAKNSGCFWREFLKGMSSLWNKKNLKKMSKDEVILITAGEEDPVGQNGKGPKWLEKTYKGLGIENVTLKLYPSMRHEIHNEKDYLTVYNDWLNFIKA